MGLFADKCQALIDVDTGKALSGQALEAARKNRKAKRCGYRVKKAAKGCSKCGSPAPGGWTRCPKCGKWVGNESDFCWHCRTALHPADRTTLSDGIWQKPAGVLLSVWMWVISRISCIRVRYSLKKERPFCYYRVDGTKIVLNPAPIHLSRWAGKLITGVIHHLLPSSLWTAAKSLFLFGSRI